ncbi:unnamed protein product [Effrenium voratum]|nr:unnamed protein product [Effrenium voratum]
MTSSGNPGFSGAMRLARPAEFVDRHHGPLGKAIRPLAIYDRAYEAMRLSGFVASFVDVEQVASKPVMISFGMANLTRRETVPPGISAWGGPMDWQRLQRLSATEIDSWAMLALALTEAVRRWRAGNVLRPGEGATLRALTSQAWLHGCGNRFDTTTEPRYEGAMATRRAEAAGQARLRASPQARRASEELAPWPTPLKTHRGDRDKTRDLRLAPPFPAPKTARGERRSPVSSPRPSPLRPDSPAKLARTQKAVTSPALPAATLLQKRQMDAKVQRLHFVESVRAHQVPVLSLEVFGAQAPFPDQPSRSRPGEGEEFFTPRSYLPDFTTLAEARFDFKQRVGAVQRSCRFSATIFERLDDLKEHMASRSTSCGSCEETPVAEQLESWPDSAVSC